MNIYESVDSRLTEIDNIVDYKLVDKINPDISTLLIILDKYIISTMDIYTIISRLVKDITPSMGSSMPLGNELKDICNTMCKDIKDDKLKESLLTLELNVGNNTKKYFKLIFINFDNKLESVYIALNTTSKTPDITTTNILKLKKNIYTHMEELRLLGSHIYHSMKKNNIYQCNMIDITSKTYLKYLNSNSFFDDKNNSVLSYTSFVNACLPIFEGFCLSKYSLNELKDDTVYNKHKTSRFNNDIVFSGGSGIKTKKTLINTTKPKPNTKLNTKLNVKLHPSTSIKKPTSPKNNYYINIVNLSTLNTKDINILYTPVIYSKLNKDLDTLLIKIKSIYFARDIINLPSNKTGSQSVINTVKHFIARNKLPINVTVYEPKECLKKGLKLLYSVGQGAEPENQSRLLILEYYGDSGKKDTKGYLLVGKGVTMDTGGVSLKPYDHIPEMKSDIAGACSVISGICGLARIGVKKNIVAMVPLSENTIGHKSTIPGDVIKAYNGLNVEIIDTDAEGRLIMADTLSYGCELYPKYNIIELSTLTGEVEKLSCGRFSIAIGINYDTDAIAKFVNVGEYNGERVIMMPFITGFDDELKSDIADIRNVSKNCKGQLYPSTAFLSYFIKDNSKYLHIDIGGTAFTDNKKYKYDYYESSGVGVKLLIDYLSI
jgi:leucyl aminopeptidase